MQSHRIISGLTVFLMVVLVAVGYFLVAQPQLAAASAANDQLASVNTQITASQTKIAQLKSEQTKLPALTAQLTSLRKSIPGDAQISSYIDGLNAMASANGVSITGITVTAAQAYAPPVGAVAAATPSSTSSTTPAATATPEPATPAVPTAWAPTTDASITATNFVAIPVTVVTSGTTPNTLAFIHSLQSGTRLFLVSGLSTTAAAAGGSSIATTIQGYIYVLLDPTATATSTATSTPTATPTVTPSPSGTATPTPTQSPTPTTKP